MEAARLAAHHCAGADCGKENGEESGSQLLVRALYTSRLPAATGE